MFSFSRLLTRLLAFAAIALTVNTFVWAAHMDTPAPADGEVPRSVHAHVEHDGMEDSKEVVENCDHCCHAGAHVLALRSDALRASLSPVLPLQVFQAFALVQAPSDPPFIPPIA